MAKKQEFIRVADADFFVVFYVISEIRYLKTVWYIVCLCILRKPVFCEIRLVFVFLLKYAIWFGFGEVEAFYHNDEKQKLRNWKDQRIKHYVNQLYKAA